MTAEKLHDAISLLPADLIAEADTVRCGKPKRIAWKRYAAMAACFALVACAAWFASLVLIPRGATETVTEYQVADSAPAAATPLAPRTEAAPQENGNITGSGREPDYAPPAVEEAPFEPVIYEEIPVRVLAAQPADRGKDALQIDWVVDLCSPRVLTSREELEACLEETEVWLVSAEWDRLRENYGTDWFAERDLVLMPAFESSSECRYRHLSLARTAENSWELTMEETFTPTDNTLDPVYRYVLLETEKGLFAEDHQLNVIIHTP